jgi:glutaredoxin
MLVVYTMNSCIYCNKAKSYLESCDISFEEKNISTDKQAKDFLLAEGHKTIPQIYYNDKLLVEGGANGLMSLSKEEIQERMENE